MGYRLPDTKARAQKLNAALAQFVALLPHTNVQKVILFGSHARQSIHSRSDIDLIVIRPTSEPFVRRADDLIQLMPPGTPVDILVYTPEEWVQLSKSRDFHRTAQREGKVIYDVQSR
ncbi:MAG TPA: nucleotidyltransferase domain-containing protein [Limnochordia bacterium]|jgi:Predicted nucleotidyltransferases|nr:nucleotidyltransferase domain-containing protein [Limnochordia bacterium]